MFLSEFRAITAGWPDDTYLVILGTSDGDTHPVTAVVPHKNGGVAYIKANVISGPNEKQ